MNIISRSICDIKGIPENADPDKLNYNADYSNLSNLKQIENISNAEINKISGENCSLDGQYIVYATLNKNENLLSKYSDVIFRISIPESNSICEVNIENINVKMICQNGDKFYNSKIITERQTLQDSEGNEIFFIDTYESSNEFACDISLLYNETTTEDDSNTSKGYERFYKRDNSLSKGAIAAIVIIIVVVIASLICIYFLLKRKRTLNIEQATEISNSPIVNLKNMS